MDVPESERSGLGLGRWVEARDLRCGDVLVLLGGEMAAVSSVSGRQEKTLVYNLSVEGSHTYSVSQAGVLVHNKALQAKPVAGAKAAASIGHNVPWAQMTQTQRNALKHSYMRHGKELGLPNWTESNAAALQQQFNNVVGHIRQNGKQLPGPIYKPWNGQSVKVNFFEWKFRGTKYYYYEDAASRTFISAGKAR